MHVGAAFIFQGTDDQRSDGSVYARELALADLAEPLGFESIWAVEHHFTNYTMCPDPLQFLTYMAGRTKRVQLGSMVVVLPWHDPVRVAEQVTMLDMMSGGRFILGIGRGLGRVEFDGFRVPMDEARPRFVEAAQVVLEGLERGYVEFDGEHYSIPRRNLRPAPGKSFKGRTYAAAVSPESIEIMAKLGVGLLIIPQKPWEQISADLASYTTAFEALVGQPAPPPIHVGWTFVDRDSERASEFGRAYIGAYYQSVVDHYEFRAGHLSTTPGYEFYARLSENLEAHGTKASEDFFTSLQVSGTPDECLEKIAHIRELTGCETFVAVTSFAGMDHTEAERNLRLVASDIAPVLREWQPKAPVRESR